MLLLNLRVFALEISIQGLPEDYTVYEWDHQKTSPQRASFQSGRFSRISFNIPDAYVIKEKGKVDLLKSLEEWRTKTGRGSGVPYTRADGIAQFPFYITDSRFSKDQSLPVTSRMTTYISLAHLMKNVEKYPEMKFASVTGVPVEVKTPSLIQDLRKITSTNVNCAPPYSNSWAPAACLVCNCANEAGIEEDVGMKMVNQVVLRRVVHKRFRDSICGVIFQKDKAKSGKIVNQFSWASTDGEFRSHDSLRAGSNLLKRCAKTSIQALQEGPSRYDHYHASTVKPSWRTSNYKKEGHHYFYTLNKANRNANASKLRAEMGFDNVIERPFDLEEVNDEGVNDVGM